MINSVVFIGRLTLINEKSIVVAVGKCFKSEDNGNDLLEAELSIPLAKATIEHCEIGDLVGVKGRLSREKEEDELKIIAEKLTFLSKKRSEK